MTGDLLFVGGDLSGIQKFIYNISSKKAMVSLKGRSAYLKRFTDEVCKRILDIPEIQKSPQDKDEMKIYCSGGKFYLQVPDTPTIRKSIDAIKRDVEAQLWEEHRGQLAINIAYLPFQYDGDNVVVDGETDNIGILWKKMTEKFTILKNQKFKDELLDSYGEFFEVQKVGGDIKVCQVTGIEGDVVPVKMYDDEEDMMVSPSVKAQIDLGKKLRDEQHFKMLEEYAGETYLGILRMDIDNLGAKFIRSDFKSMKKYKQFSLALDWFFDAEHGRLHDLQTQDEYREFLNIVYAGGDDIFVVGRWDKVIDFAARIKEEFKSYCHDKLEEETLSISGGVAIVNAKFPIAKAAEMAGEAEDAAKKYNNKQKNAFNMFGESISWENEFDYVKSYKEQFVTLINKANLSRGILHKIMTYEAIVKENQVIAAQNEKGDQKRKPDLSYLWHTTYYLTRFMGKEKDNKAVYLFCKDLRDKQLLSAEKFRLMALAARWAELELRMNNSTNNKNE